ncbi:DEAD/DEAH box helicase [Verrucomicrobia bacterium S94]|nr:DEAD/DEAH box helicase [Verrucomicrobia bacterium S94]
MLTGYHAKYYAYELMKQGGEGVERLSRSLFDAAVDLNPHQIDAALFALRSPLTKGVLLADEVGLGKTIEAGLVLCQLWAERKRKLLIICPAALRKQWSLELDEKFNLPSIVLDSKSFRDAQKDGSINPFDGKRIIICSMHFAARNADLVQAVQWDMTVIDEAHKLRNSYRESNRIGQNIRFALEDARKILLTATPLQNSLLELYGLCSLLDERIFADVPSFRTQYMNSDGDLLGLKQRLGSFCKRTLREQVQEYVPYTNRKLITRPFEPTDQEQKLYKAVSAFLQRKDTYAMPYRQKHLTALIVRKLLASSPLAVAGTLEAMRKRLIALKETEQDTPIIESILQEEELENEILEDVLGDEQSLIDFEGDCSRSMEKIDLVKLQSEIDELGRFIEWAQNIGVDTKAKSLLTALDVGFEQMAKSGAARKAVIFTESRRTQDYVKTFLENNGFKGKVVSFNGTNSDAEASAYYEDWKKVNRTTGRVTGSRAVDVRTALLDRFKEQAEILIATEAGAEGINLQFCSLVVNYDLPWNPQRVEQRIGRCHRYGQRHDVVVVNFLNKKNEADCRVYELLQHKFNLFEGVFGASDEVLGVIESGIDFERRILEIYQECRSPEEIQAAFDRLQDEFEESIQVRMTNTRRVLLENFDADVHERLRVHLLDSQEFLDRFSRMFWALSRYVLHSCASFDETALKFQLDKPPQDGIRPGEYCLISKKQTNLPGEFLYRLSHPLGEYVIEQGRTIETPEAQVTFDVSSHPVKISQVEVLKGKSGWLVLEQLIIDSCDIEEHLLFSGFVDDGPALSQEEFEKLFQCSGNSAPLSSMPDAVVERLDKEAERHANGVLAQSLERNSEHFNEARERLWKWAEDLELAAQKELQKTKDQIKALNREARKAVTLEEQEALQMKIREFEKKKRRQRQKIFDVEDEIEQKRDLLIEDLEKRLSQKTEKQRLFTIRWRVI